MVENVQNEREMICYYAEKQKMNYDTYAYTCKRWVGPKCLVRKCKESLSGVSVKPESEVVRWWCKNFG